MSMPSLSSRSSNSCGINPQLSVANPTCPHGVKLLAVHSRSHSIAMKSCDEVCLVLTHRAVPTCQHSKSRMTNSFPAGESGAEPKVSQSSVVPRKKSSHTVKAHPRPNILSPLHWMTRPGFGAAQNTSKQGSTAFADEECAELFWQ